MPTGRAGPGAERSKNLTFDSSLHAVSPMGRTGSRKEPLFLKSNAGFAAGVL
jgi:hypothetical protein